jgi:hypothetical protein
MTTKTDYKRETIEELAKNLIAAGYRVFISKTGTYGFYTDKEGTKIISFQMDLLSVSASGNYKTSEPSRTGGGWQITDCFSCFNRYPSVNKVEADKVFNAYPPSWALGSATFKYTTLEQHLKQYGQSSGYVEFFVN